MIVGLCESPLTFQAIVIWLFGPFHPSQPEDALLQTAPNLSPEKVYFIIAKAGKFVKDVVTEAVMPKCRR
jgi:hypothetical protein